MDLLTALSTCSLAKDFPLVLSMALTFSHGEPLTVRAAAEVGDVQLFDPTQGAQDGVRTKDAALADIRRIKQPIIGLLPVPAAWAPMYQAEPSQLLDACTNVSIATAQLSAYERSCEGRGRLARACALHAYADAAGIPLFEVGVLESLQEQHAPADGSAVIETDDVLGSSLFVAASTDDRKCDARRIFVSAELPDAEKSSPQPLRSKTDVSQPEQQPHQQQPKPIQRPRHPKEFNRDRVSLAIDVHEKLELHPLPPLERKENSSNE